MHEVKPSRDAVLDQQHSYSLNPLQNPGCKVIWSINGQIANLGDEVGGLKVLGMNGTISVKVTGEVRDTVVSAIVNCHGTVHETIPYVHQRSVVPLKMRNKWGEFLTRILRAVGLTFNESR